MILDQSIVIFEISHNYVSKNSYFGLKKRTLLILSGGSKLVSYYLITLRSKQIIIIIMIIMAPAGNYHFEVSTGVQYDRGSISSPKPKGYTGLTRCPVVIPVTHYS